MPLKLRPRFSYSDKEPALPIDLSGVLPSSLRDKTLAEIERWPVRRGKHQVPLAECFDLSGSAEDNAIVCEGDFRHVHHIGEGLREGSIRIVGSAGRHVAAGMQGGEVLVEGDTDDWAAAEIRGGKLDIQGNTSDHLASAYPGSRRGVNGGFVFVRGNCGHEAAYRLRRGSVAVTGNVGDHPAAEMIAGSFFIFGRCGSSPGIGMRRGTLVCLNHTPHLLPTFQPACRYKPAFLRFYLKELQRAGFPVGLELLEAHYLRVCGDLASLGKGEILYRL